MCHCARTSVYVHVVYSCVPSFPPHRKRKGKKEKSESGGDRKSRASMADFDFSEESIEELARKFGITEAKIRQMGTHSGKLENQEKENEEEEEDDDDDDDDSILQTKSQV